MEQLIGAQYELHGRISRTHMNLKKTGVSRITGALIASTIRLLDSKWEKFEEHHERLRAKYWKEFKQHDYYLQDFLGQTEQAYVQQRAALLELEEELQAKRED